MDKVDVAIVGAGLVGLAAAYSIKREFPRLKLHILEKENAVAMHQSGHNSGVIHSGIYYKPGTLKAENCRAGKALLEKFCTDNGIRFQTCGKVIVATQEAELPTLDILYERGIANGVRCEKIDRVRLSELEPGATGLKAIHVPEAGIVDFPAVAIKLRDLLLNDGVDFSFGSALRNVVQDGSDLILASSKGEHRTKFLLNCAGLYSDQVLKMAGDDIGVRIIPFRGEYYLLKPEFASVCKNLIYPVPDPEFPFLGVHLTRMINGSVECGPNAVLGMAREAYRKFDFNLREFSQTLFFPGFRKFAFKHWRAGALEVKRSFSRRAFVKALQRLAPSLREEHIVPAEAGVRAQAVSRDGKILDDFCIHRTKSALHVLNAPSPAATSCLSIGRKLTEMARQELAVL